LLSESNTKMLTEVNIKGWKSVSNFGIQIEENYEIEWILEFK